MGVLTYTEVTPMPSCTVNLTLDILDEVDALDQVAVVENAVVKFDKVGNDVIMYVGPTDDDLSEVNRWTVS